MVGLPKNLLQRALASLCNLLPLAGSNGGAVVRQRGGTAGTDELQISHAGATGAIAESKRGPIALRPNSAAQGDLIQIQDGNGSNNKKYHLTATRLGMVSGVVVTWNSSATATDGGTDDLKADRPAAGVLRISGTAAGAGGWLQVTGGEARRTATQTVTDSVAFAADNALSVTLAAGRRYRFLLEYFFTTVNTSGVKVDLNGGTATMTAINGFGFLYGATGAVGNAAQITALTSSVALTASGTFAFVSISGTLECNAAGTFAPRFAQNTETGAAESAVAQIGSYLTLTDIL